MNKIKQRIMQFMIGRYGIDELYFGLFGLWFLVLLLNGFIQSTVLTALSAVLLILMIWRIYSKKIDSRRRENAVFLRFWSPVRSWFILQRDRFHDRKTARYRKCPFCKAILKLPNKKGKHATVCPKCHQRFDVKVF